MLEERNSFTCTMLRNLMFSFGVYQYRSFLRSRFPCIDFFLIHPTGHPPSRGSSGGPTQTGTRQIFISACKCVVLKQQYCIWFVKLFISHLDTSFTIIIIVIVIVIVILCVDWDHAITSSSMTTTATNVVVVITRTLE